MSRAAPAQTAVPIGREVPQRRDLLKGLDNQHDDVEVLSDHGGDYIGAPPWSDQVIVVTRREGGRQNDQRQDAQGEPGSKSLDGKQEPGHAGGGRGGEKDRGPRVETLRDQQPPHDDESGADAHEADSDVNDGQFGGHSFSLWSE